uniref:Translation initiation factor IF-2, chloroplastic n=1 Tax=Helminthora furcellata TaxID=1884666 RepID=A0A1G4NR55_9FLOR|nr:Translation initiation factor 2 [Helminthora furcellata]SCW21147.1 Translation initiation factor 2 [Helminthora furcellata]SCW24007.1 Translation initiation factor 2 [Helminthora furcellata]
MNFIKVNKETGSSWLNLDNPKLIYYEGAQSSDTSSSIQSIPDVIVNDINNIITTRSEKKSKSYSNLVDPLEVKKNKVKIKKKTRSKIHINDEDDNLDNRYHAMAKAGRNLEISLMRPPKPAKKKLPKKNIVVNKEITTIPLKGSKDINSGVSNEHAIKEIAFTHPLSIQELENLISIPAAEIIKYLFLRGISVTINQVIDVKMAKSIATNYNINFVSSDNENNLTTSKVSGIKSSLSQWTEDRTPIVTIFGHVDHGKTTLLDAICDIERVNKEYGGITQAIVAHEILINTLDTKEKVIFLDTPGHEAFSDMRMRSIHITDVAILVVAADDGLQQQSKEAIQYFKTHQLPFIVAINKVDKEGANIDHIKQELSNYDIVPEESGGKVPVIEISALKKNNIDNLLLALFKINSEQTLKANSSIEASGTVLDSYLDKKKGPVAKLLIQNGTIRVGNYLLSNQIVSKVRAISNSIHESINHAGPSSIVDVYGMESILGSGNSFNVINDQKIAKKQLAEYQKNKDKYTKDYKKLNTRLTLDGSIKEGNILNTKVVNIILKTDTEGTIDAIINAFIKIPQNKVQINLIGAGVGQITEADINLATISNATIISFYDTPAQIKNLAAKSNIPIANFNIIYDLLDYLQDLMIQLVPIEFKENKIGKAIVQNTFSVSKGIVAGCNVTEGKLKKGSNIKVIREQEIIYTGEITSLKRIKEDVAEVVIGNECGVMSINFSLWEHKDIIEAYDLIEQEKTL